MEIFEIKKRKETLEKELLSIVQEKTNQFQKETGCSVSGINIYGKEERSIGSLSSEYYIHRVDLEIKI